MMQRVRQKLEKNHFVMVACPKKYNIGYELWETNKICLSGKSENLLADFMVQFNRIFSRRFKEASFTNSAFELHGYMIKNNIQEKLLIVLENFECVTASYKNQNFITMLMCSAKPYPISQGKVNNNCYVAIVCEINDVGHSTHFNGLTEMVNSSIEILI